MQRQSRGIRGGKSSPTAAAHPHQLLCKSHCNSHQGYKARPNHHHCSHETTQKSGKATSESLNYWRNDIASKRTMRSSTAMATNNLQRRAGAKRRAISEWKGEESRERIWEIISTLRCRWNFN
ncbi:hypothetical protein V6N13_083079 [Hibiscus sabdariffa]